jgi:hypothetical protein
MTKNEAKTTILNFIKEKMDQNRQCMIDIENLENTLNIPKSEIDHILDDLEKTEKIDLISHVGSKRSVTLRLE